MDHMSLNYFQLNQRPFSTTPVAEHCCLFPSFQNHLEAVEVALSQQLGPSLILGGAGTGKTMLLRTLAQRLTKTDGMCVSIDAAFSNRDEFFQTLLFELGLEQLRSSSHDPRLALTSAIRSRPEFATGICLLIDEAHSLNHELFEQLRLLSNMVRDGRSVFQIALAGSHALEELLLTPSLESLQQRLACRVYLTGMSLDELRGYIDFQWRRSGGQQSPFSAESIQAIHTATMGIPRLVNQLCDQAINYATAQRVPTIDSNTIQVAWAMWQRLPIPQQANSASTPNTTRNVAKHEVVEFGCLDDEPATLQGDHVVSEVEPSPTQSPTRPVTEIVVSKVAAMPVDESPETLIRFAFETDIQKPVARLDSNPAVELPRAPITPSSITNRSLRELDVKLDTIQQALASLQEPWEPIDEMLIEADLQAAVAPVEIFDQTVQSTQQMVSNDPAIVFQDHLYLESLWMEDTVWTQYIRTPDSLDEVSPVSLPLPSVQDQLSPLNAVPSTGESIATFAIPSTEIRIDEKPHLRVNPPQSVSRWESVPPIDSPPVEWTGAELALGPEVRSSDDAFQDDARIIHRQPVSADGDATREPHPAHSLSPPVLARRKDLRALLHALRGY
jgi:type II secretory pathway predicted ATPase ExeA